MHGVSAHARDTKVLRLPYRCSRRRFGRPWVGLINGTLKRLNLPTVTPGTTSTLSASIFLWQFLDPFSSSLIPATINLQHPLHTGSYTNYQYLMRWYSSPHQCQTTGDPLSRSRSIPFPLPFSPRCPSSSAPLLARLSWNLCSPMRSSALANNDLFVCTVASTLLHQGHWSVNKLLVLIMRLDYTGRCEREYCLDRSPMDGYDVLHYCPLPLKGHGSPSTLLLLAYFTLTFLCTWYVINVW